MNSQTELLLSCLLFIDRNQNLNINIAVLLNGKKAKSVQRDDHIHFFFLQCDPRGVEQSKSMKK